MMLERSIEVRDLNMLYDAKRPGILVTGTIAITTPEQEPALIELDFRTRLKSLPPNPETDLAPRVLRILSDRLRDIPPKNHSLDPD